MEKKYTYKIFRSFATFLVAVLAFCGEAIAESVGSSSTGFFVAWNGSWNSTISGVSSCDGKVTVTVTISSGESNCWIGFAHDGSIIPYSESNVVSNITSSTGTGGSGSDYLAEFHTPSFGYAGNGPWYKISFASSGTYTFNFSYSNGVVTVSDGQASCGPTITGSLIAPAAVCDLETLTVAAPTGVSGADSTGWQISPVSDFSSGVGRTKNSSPSDSYSSTVTYSQNGYYIRYWASGGGTTNYTTPVQVTVNSCGPTISDITQPATICAGGALTISNPTTVTAPAGTTIVSQGWEYCSTVDGTYTPIADFASFKASVAGSYKNYYLRYYATNEKAKSVSNAVQIKMFDAPTLNPTTPVQPTAVCNGNALSDLANPSVNLYGASLSTTRWEISTDNVTYSSFNPSTTLSTVSNNGNYLHYVAVNNCGASVTSNPIQIEVLSPTLTMDALANKKAAAGYVKSIAFPQVVTNKCVGTLVYTYTVDKNTSDFTINSTTGELKTKTTLPIGIYTITISASDGVVSDSKTFSLEVIADTPVTLSCSGDSRSLSPCETMTDVTFTVSSHDLVQDITLSLQGSASAFFTVTPSTVTKNTTDVQVTLHQTQALPLGSTTLQVVPISDGAEYSSCNWTFNVSSPITGAITKPTIQTANQTCPLSGSATLSANVSGVSISEYGPCSGYPLYKWILNGQEVSSASTYGDYSIPSISGATSGDYTLRIYVGPNAYIESPAYTLDYPLQLSIVGEKPEYYCAESVSLQATIGASVYTSRYEWYNGEERIARTSETTYEMPLNCTGLDSDVPLLVRVVSDDGCVYTATKTVHIKKYNNVYYYCGGTDAASNVTDYTNWCTVENGTTTSCTHPSVNFDADGCQYIINKDNVELKDGQIWNVSGVGSKITIGNGKWTSLSDPGSITMGSVSYGNPWGGDIGVNYRLGGGDVSSPDRTTLLEQIANSDFRSNAKTFTIKGTVNLSGKVTIDVRSGSELNIATDKGNPTLGVLETDHANTSNTNFNQAIVSGGVFTGQWCNISMIPGSIVTYSGTGTTAVQGATYSDLYIDASVSKAVTVDPGQVVVVMQSFKYLDSETRTYNVEGSSFVFAGSYNQVVPSMTYDSLLLYNSNIKTLAGDIQVTDVLNIASGCTLSPGTKTITLSGCNEDGVVIDYEGNFIPGTSTVKYVGACNQIVAPMPYYNLNVDAPSISTETRTFSPKDIIGIAGTFTIDPTLTNTVAYTTTNSTIEFNGTSGQAMPTFTYYNLVINNSGLKDGASLTNTDNFLSMSGNVVVTNQLSMSKGVLNTNNHNLTITNTAANAVLDGYYKSDTDQSFIEGTLIRNLPQGLTNDEDVSKYIYPVGNYTLGGYMPLTVQGVTTGTGSSPTLSVSVKTSTPNTSSLGTYLSSVNSAYYWDASGSPSYTAGRVTLSTPRGDQTLISSEEGTTKFNCVAYENGSNPWEALNGTTISPKLIKAYPQGSGLYTFGTRTVSYHTYYYNCAAGGDITNLSSWFTGEFGTGDPPTSFTEDYATWIIECNATISSNFAITGSNTNVILRGTSLANGNVSPTLTVASGKTEFISFKIESVNSKPAYFAVSEDAEFDVYQILNLGKNDCSIVNNGTMNVFAEDFEVNDALVENHGTMNFSNCDLLINGGESQKDPRGRFLNYSVVNMTNSGLMVSGRYTQLYNSGTSNAIWKIDNSTSSVRRAIQFTTTEFRTNEDPDYTSPNDGKDCSVNLNCGSTFFVKNSDVNISYGGMIDDYMYIGGDFIVEDGNMSLFRNSGGNGGKPTFLSCSKVLLYDTDNSGGGILYMNGSEGITTTVLGTLYAVGLVTSSQKGSTFNIEDGGFAFVGDMGATMPGYSWNSSINVYQGGTLNYCGNRTSASDNIGTNQGSLNYAESFYMGTDPILEKDFTNINPGDVEALYGSISECMDAFDQGTQTAYSELLPIELTMLYGICVDETIVLHWQTMSETNSDYFAILRSFDGVTFEEVETMSASGTTTEMHNYSYDDKVDYSGIVYYKLRQYDFDGKYTDSKIIAVQTCGKNAQFLFKENEIEVTFENPAERNTVIITSITGMILYSKTFDSVETARIAMPRTSGVYIISAIDNKQITSEKFINK